MLIEIVQEAKVFYNQVDYRIKMALNISQKVRTFSMLKKSKRYFKT